MNNRVLFLVFGALFCAFFTLAQSPQGFLEEEDAFEFADPIVNSTAADINAERNSIELNYKPLWSQLGAETFFTNNLELEFTPIQHLGMSVGWEHRPLRLANNEIRGLSSRVELTGQYSCFFAPKIGFAAGTGVGLPVAQSKGAEEEGLEINIFSRLALRVLEKGQIQFGLSAMLEPQELLETPIFSHHFSMLWQHGDLLGGLEWNGLVANQAYMAQFVPQVNILLGKMSIGTGVIFPYAKGTSFHEMGFLLRLNLEWE